MSNLMRTPRFYDDLADLRIIRDALIKAVQGIDLSKTFLEN